MNEYGDDGTYQLHILYVLFPKECSYDPSLVISITESNTMASMIFMKSCSWNCSKDSDFLVR